MIDLVQSIRNVMPKLGTRKLFFLLKKDLARLSIGRDKLFKILKANNLLIKPKKKYHITTDSHHRFRKHKNLINCIDINRPESVWVSDITYIGTRKHPCYLALITDAYSKKIMGYNVSESLNVAGSIKALKMALRNRKHTESPLIHHSDRGLQYCSFAYQNLIAKNNIKPSMTEKYDPYENAIAERVNGILKQEFNINIEINNLEIKTKLVKNAIRIYNNLRPHLSNYMMTPEQMHNQNIVKRRTYKSKNLNKNIFVQV